MNRGDASYPAPSDDSPVGKARRLYREALDAQRDQRLQIQEDTRFSDPSKPDQWEERVRIAREQDPGGVRPCLVFDQCGQYVANVAGQIEKQPPSLHAIPVSGGADKQAAEQIDGRFRHIEYASRAEQHYQTDLTNAARLGVGYLIVRPAYVNRALNWQEPRISTEPDVLKVVLDPWSKEKDGSDANYAFVLDTLSRAEFDRRWPGKDACDFGTPEIGRGNEIRDSVTIAEHWYIEDTTRNMIVHVGADGEQAALPEDDYWGALKTGAVPPQQQPPRAYKDKTRTVKWCLMSGADVLEESVYLSDFIGVVPTYGYLGWKDGRMTYCGIPRRARNAQQAYNYHRSEEQAYIGTAPRSPWMASKRAISGFENIWDLASTQARAYLPYNDRDEDGEIAMPQRMNAASNLVNHQAGAEQALRDIQASIGMYQANLGAPSNETSGVAIEGRKQQGEASTAHFPSHMAASLAQVGKIVMQMDARLADTRRKQALIGVDGTPGSVTVDPDQAEAFKRGPDGVTINPKVGDYGVRVVVGASYSTQRTQTNAAFSEIMRGNPEMTPVVAPFWAQTLDFPGSDKLAQAFAAMAPPPVKAILQPEGQDKQPDPAELMQKIAQMGQALQQAAGIAQETQQELDEIHGELAKAQMALADKTDSIDNDRYKAETDRLKVTGANVEQVTALVQQLVNDMLMSPTPLPGDHVPGMQLPTAPQMPEPQPQQPQQAIAPEAPISGSQPQPLTQDAQPVTEPQA